MANYLLIPLDTGNKISRLITMTFIQFYRKNMVELKAIFAANSAALAGELSFAEFVWEVYFEFNS